MKRHLLATLVLCTLASNAIAASTVYLKDGGKIRAQSVWRSNGRVYVLVNRDSLTDFSPAEINLKRTFAHKHHATKKPATTVASQQDATAPSSAPAAETQKSGGRIKSMLNRLPNLPDRSPESLVPSSGAGGTIRQHKKEMAERVNE